MHGRAMADQHCYWHGTDIRVSGGRACRGLSRRRKRRRIMAPTCAPLLVLRNTSSGLQPLGSFSLSILYCAQDVTAGPRHQPCLRICMEHGIENIINVSISAPGLERKPACMMTTLHVGGIMDDYTCWAITFVPPAPSELDT